MGSPVAVPFKKSSCLFCWPILGSLRSAICDHVNCTIQRISFREVLHLILVSQIVNICIDVTEKFRQLSHNLLNDGLISYLDMKHIAEIWRRSAFCSDHSLHREIVHHSSDSWSKYVQGIRRKKDSKRFIFVKNNNLSYNLNRCFYRFWTCLCARRETWSIEIWWT